MDRWLPLLGLLLAVAPACGRKRPVVYPGFVDSPVAAVAAQVSGQVATVLVREGERVRPGQLLVQLDAREREALVSQAQANLERAQESLREAERNAEAVAPTVRGAVADIARQQAELEDARAELARMEALARTGAASASQLDSARARFGQARAAVASLGAARQATSGRAIASLASVRTARAAVVASQAALDLARIQLSQAEIRSPFDGMVAEQNLQAGEWSAAGTPVVTVEDLTRQWVRVDVGETELGPLRLGLPAEVRVKAFPGRRYTGHVIEIGAEGEFALNRDVKRGRPDIRTFRIRVGLDHMAEELRPGMTAEVILGRTPERP
jgi:multidrug resistance efflux pump